MEYAVAPTRVFEYPADLSGCCTLDFGNRQLLYICSHEGRTSFVVILGFFSGQKEDVITKDLIEPVKADIRFKVRELVSKSMPAEYWGAHIFFL